MKVHQLASVELWEQEPSLSLGCNKRLRPLAPKLGHSLTVSIIDLKSFIKPQNVAVTKNSTPQSEVQSGGTRWNPTQEQIEILERLYRGGMRTPNAQEIEQITLHLGKYGKIEGKNVFYWFQNHKARERQRQKRVGLSTTRPVVPLSNNVVAECREAEEASVQNFPWDDSGYKRRCRPWVVQSFEDEKEEHQTLELFPLKPEGAN